MTGKCGFCFSDYSTTRQPRLLPCGHSICAACLEHMCRSQCIIKCPQCCASHQIDSTTLMPSGSSDINSIHMTTVTASTPSSTNPSAVGNAKFCHVMGCKREIYKQCFHCQRYLCPSHLKDDEKLVMAIASEKLEKATVALNRLESASKFTLDQTGLMAGYDDAILHLTLMLSTLENEKTKVETAKEETIASLSNQRQFIGDLVKCMNHEVNELRNTLGHEKVNSRYAYEKYKQLDELIENTNAMDMTFTSSEVAADWNSVTREFDGVTKLIEIKSRVHDIVQSKAIIQERQSMTQQFRRSSQSTVLPEIQDTPAVNIMLDAKPENISVSYNTRGYRVVNNIMEESINEELRSLPSTILFIQFRRNFSSLLVLNDMGENVCTVNLSFSGVADESVKIEAFACCNSRQALLFVDSSNKCIHVTNLSGLSQNMIGNPTTLKSPKGLCIDDSDDTEPVAFVCDRKRKKIVAFSITSGDVLFSIGDSSIGDLGFASFEPHSKSIWVTEPTENSLLIFSLHEKKLIDRIKISMTASTSAHIFNTPKGIAHDDKGAVWITSNQHCSTMKLQRQEANEQTFKHFSSFGSDQTVFCSPRGICFVNAREQFNKMIVVCDTGNKRLVLLRQF